MIPDAMNHRFLPLLATLALALVALPSLSLGQAKNPKAPPGPGEAGDALLPAGYKGVVWGASSEVVEALRNRTLERQSTTSSHVVYLIEAPPPGDKETKKVVKWKFWDDALIEVQVHYEGPFNKVEGRELVHKFESRYGAGIHEERKQKQHYNWSDKTDLLVDEWWTWQDSYTIQMLKKNFDDNSWTTVRKSRVLEANRDQQKTDERTETHTDRVQDIDLD